MNNGRLPSISVAMSVYNAEQFLALAIESILTQSFTDFEFLILDDGSNDGSRAIIDLMPPAIPASARSFAPTRG
jgi:glycosyltransferase involved in cell wall biosynthesis